MTSDFGEYFAQIFKHSVGNFVTFLCQFLEKLVKNYPKNEINFQEISTEEVLKNNILSKISLNNIEGNLGKLGS